MNNINYNPDVLDAIANLSNDEVFTPPRVVNQILDMLPQELFESKETTFLDPATKSGVFLREIAKRLMKGLEKEIPDIQERANHIFANQLFGIAITELTSLLSRRTLYGSKIANGKYSFCTTFENNQGNIIFKNINHTWKNGKCSFCGASEEVYKRDKNLETYAYLFIHRKRPKDIFKMKFDVIIGNPPYQLSSGGYGAQATPIYNKFVEQAKKLNPRYLTMIIPARWYSGGMGLNKFREEMLNDKKIRVLHDFINARDVFPSVEIKGGVCYFLWDRDNEGKCKVVTHKNGKIVSEMERFLLEEGQDVFIRHNEAIPILKKVLSKKEKSFSEIVSSQRPFDLPTNFKDFEEEEFENSVKIYANKKIGYIEKDKIKRGLEYIDKFKIFVPKAIGSGDMKTDLIKPILGERNSCCTETYIMIGPFETEKEAKNAISYIKTKFFHFLIGLLKITQDSLKRVYKFVPMQDFSKSWSDEELYKKYNLTEEEINFIESMIREME
jgi:site-specific DNA-methyltransferase (adenine-specific)